MNPRNSEQLSYRKLTVSQIEDGDIPGIFNHWDNLKTSQLIHNRLTSPFFQKNSRTPENESLVSLEIGKTFHIACTTANTLLIQGLGEIYQSYFDNPQTQHHGIYHHRRAERWMLWSLMQNTEHFQEENSKKIFAAAISLRFHDIMQLINHHGGNGNSIREGHEAGGAILTRALSQNSEQILHVSKKDAEWITKAAAIVQLYHDSPFLGRTLGLFQKPESVVFGGDKEDAYEQFIQGKLNPLDMTNEKLWNIYNKSSNGNGGFPQELMDKFHLEHFKDDTTPWFTPEDISNLRDIFELLSIPDTIEMIYPPSYCLRRKLAGPYSARRPFLLDDGEKTVEALRRIEAEDSTYSTEKVLYTDVGRTLIELDYWAKLMEKCEMFKNPVVNNFARQVVMQTLFYLEELGLDFAEKGYSGSQFPHDTGESLVGELFQKDKSRNGNHTPSNTIPDIVFYRNERLSQALEGIEWETHVIGENLRSKGAPPLDKAQLTFIMRLIQNYFQTRLGISEEEIEVYKEEYERIINSGGNFPTPYGTFVGTGKASDMQIVDFMSVTK